jgi:bacterial/archaeal transporter family protein
MTNYWLFWAALSAVFAALVTILAKAGLKDIDPDFAQLLRTAIVLPVLAVLVLATGKWQSVAQWSGKAWLYIVLSGLATCAAWVCYFRALDLGKSSQVSAVDKLSVVLIAVLAVTMLGEQISAATWCGITFIAVGVVIVSLAK